MTAAIIGAIAICLAFAAGVILHARIIARVNEAERTITTTMRAVRDAISQDVTAIHNRIAAIEKALKVKK